MAAAMEGIVVWEWQDDFKNWQAYKCNMSDFIEDENKKKNSSSGSISLSSYKINLGSVDPSFQLYNIDLLLMLQIRTDTGKTRAVQRQVYPADSAMAHGISWKFETDISGIFLDYTPQVNCLIEAANNKGQTTLDLSMAVGAKFPYVLDLQNLIQTRTDTGKIRCIRRERSTFVYTARAPLPGSLPMMPMPSASASSAGFFSPYIPSGSFLASLPNPPFMHSMSSSVAPTPPTSVYAFPMPSSLPMPMFSPPPFLGSTPSFYGPSSGMPSVLPARSTPSTYLSSPAKRPATRSSKKSSSATKGSAGPMAMRSSGTVFTTSSEGGGDFAVTADDVLNTYTAVYSPMLNEKEDDCCICCENLKAASGFAEEGIHSENTSAVVKLTGCCHSFHRLCLTHMYNNGPKEGSLQCPSCKAIYGVKTGNCPPGRMDYNIISECVAGYEGDGAIHITYNIPNGIQGPQHPYPGQPYHAYGFPRQAFLPNNAEGRKVLKLLIKAFERRLTFTIGTSVTTSRPNCVVWNEIHHKTEFHSNSSGHGYPDDKYLENVMAELAAHGVGDDT